MDLIDVTDELPVELAFLLACARLTMSAEEVDAAREMLLEHRETFDWGLFLDQCSRHKVVEMVFRNLFRSGIADERVDRVALIPVPHRRLMEAAYAANKVRNAAMVDELDELVAGLEGAGLRVASRKGPYLARYVYGDMALRPMLDLDFLIERSEAKALGPVMESLGYGQGNIGPLGRVVEPWSAAAIKVYLLTLPNLPSYVRPLGLPNLGEIEVDFVTSLFARSTGFSIDTTGLLDRAQRVRVGANEVSVLSDEDYLIDLCAHLYKEAKSFFYIELEKDLTLLKFCDVAEYLRFTSGTLSVPTFLDRVRENGIEVPMFFTLYLTSLIYAGTVPQVLLDSLWQDDADVLHTFGELDRQPAAWLGPLARRLFSSARVWHAGGRSRLPRH